MAKKTPDAPGQCLIHFKGEEMGSLTRHVPIVLIKAQKVAALYNKKVAL
jgi:hypothetical protein